MESTFVSSSEHNSAHIFNDPREELYIKLIPFVPNNRPTRYRIFFDVPIYDLHVPM